MKINGRKNFKEAVIEYKEELKRNSNLWNILLNNKN